jgi:hypothetical protein
MRWVHGLMAALFVFSAALQLNDPDPVPWVAIYLAGAALAGMAAAGRWPPWRRPVALAVAGIALVWGLSVAFSSPRVPPLADLVGDWHMYAVGVEERRETLALLWLACWSALVALPPSRGGVTRRVF